MSVCRVWTYRLIPRKAPMLTLDEEKAFFEAQQRKTPWQSIAMFCLGAQHGIDVARRKEMSGPRPIETYPKSGRFWVWWRTKRINKWTAVEWSEGGRHLWTDAGVAVHEPEVSFSYWLPEPSSPLINRVRQPC